MGGGYFHHHVAPAWLAIKSGPRVVTQVHIIRGVIRRRRGVVEQDFRPGSGCSGPPADVEGIIRAIRGNFGIGLTGVEAMPLGFVGDADDQLLGNLHIAIKSEDEQTPYDLGKGFEENDALNRVMADFGVDQKNKTKIIEFLISMSKQGQGQAPGATAAKPPTPPAVQKAFITNLSGQTK